MSDSENAVFKSRFQAFANEARGNSPLYEHLSLSIAQDDDVASLLTAAPQSQQRPNLLFAAIHHLLLGGVNHSLSAYYPSVGGTTGPDDNVYRDFRSFIRDFKPEIVERLKTRSTQTNEPGRCGPLRAGLARLRAQDRPVALVELGASAGLLLHLDRYRYRYRNADVGPSDSGVVIEPEIRGAPPQEVDLPEIAERIGIDLEPLNPSNSEDGDWLKACVWPEDLTRLRRLDAALGVAARFDDVRFVNGDLTELLDPVVREIPRNLLVCVIHSAAFAYLDEATRGEAEMILDRLGTERDLARLAFEGPFIEPFARIEKSLSPSDLNGEMFLLGLTRWMSGTRSDELLARSHPHGAWLEWFHPPATDSD